MQYMKLKCNSSSQAGGYCSGEKEAPVLRKTYVVIDNTPLGIKLTNQFQLTSCKMSC